CCRAVNLALSADDVSRIGAAQTRGRFAQRVEHRLQIKGRAADDLQHVAGRRLVFERFFEVVRAALQFIEEARILDGDHRLIGKRRDQSDLFVRKRVNLPAVDMYGTEESAVFAQRDAKDRPRPHHLNDSPTPRIIDPFSGEVGDVDEVLAAYQAIVRGVRLSAKGLTQVALHKLLRDTVLSNGVELLAVITRQ